MKKVDLHMHTSISADGTYSPEELVKLALKQNMEVIAVTDHNSVKAVKRAIETGKEKGIRVIPAIELDCEYEGVNLHMTGYGIDVDDVRYAELEKYVHDQYVDLTWKSTRAFLKAMNLQIDDSVLEGIAVQGMIVPEDLAELLLSSSEYAQLEWLKPYRPGGSRSENPCLNFYWDFFSQGKIGAYNDVKKPAEEIIHLIHDTGGKAFVAHPEANFKGKEETLKRLLQQVDGLEVFSTYHTLSEVQKYLQMAESMNILISAGSDYHGHHKPSIQIGRIPGINEFCSEEMIKWVEELV